MYEGLPWFGVSFTRVESKGELREVRFKEILSERYLSFVKNLRDFLNLDYHVMS